MFTKKKKKKKTMPGALLWDYENWPRVRISREGWRGAVLLLVFFFPVLAGSVLYWAELYWVWSGFCCQFPEHRDPFFSCQSQPDVPRLALRILIPYPALLSALSESYN